MTTPVSSPWQLYAAREQSRPSSAGARSLVGSKFGSLGVWVSSHRTRDRKTSHRFVSLSACNTDDTNHRFIQSRNRVPSSNQWMITQPYMLRIRLVPLYTSAFRRRHATISFGSPDAGLPDRDRGERKEEMRPAEFRSFAQLPPFVLPDGPGNRSSGDRKNHRQSGLAVPAGRRWPSDTAPRLLRRIGRRCLCAGGVGAAPGTKVNLPAY